MKLIIGVLAVLGLNQVVWADDEAWFGTWVERGPTQMTMTIEKSGDNTKVTYRMAEGYTPNFLMTFESRYDGTAVPVLIDGKPSGETMTMKRIDDRHIAGAWRMQGGDGRTSQSELSADGEVIKVVGESMVPGPDGKRTMVTQYWDKK